VTFYPFDPFDRIEIYLQHRLVQLFTGSGVQNGATGSPLAGRLFVVIGVGCAGKALAYGAKAKGARIVIANWTHG
jgi:phosphoglycerate dehydrogenase-like enzyme